MTWRRGLRWLLAALVVGFGIWLVWHSTDDLGAAVRRLNAPAVIVAGVAAVGGTIAMQRSWLALLDGLLDPADAPDPGAASRVFYVSQLGKYLPGSVWPVLAQMEFGKRWGIGRTVMFAANMLFMATITATGIATGALLLPWSSSEGLTRYWWLLLALIPLAIGLHPRTLPAMLDWLMRRLGREPLGITLRGAGLRRALGWAAIAWLVMGAHVAILASAFDSPGVGEVAASIGAIALGWAAGIAFIPAPAGAGVRDTLIAVGLTPFIGTTPAVTVALASRVLLLIADVALAIVAALRQRAVSSEV
ncbi:lysylphosphatidylglycerol synthase domain-containing protein [Nocardioides sp.]|uniref:lysylphosphatidylglycerol synthase domain-containing protein n=1 Tax=Nocardioides sp. TaxID=35761 RepID=UPI00262FC990|nr:lysylphosphatidylglycerol synthase domain-containing protein [Nocardioides sp.]